jgi:hypothetical protein
MIDTVIAELQRQLDWVGPGGRGQGHIVLTRPQAEAVIAELRRLDLARAIERDGQ